MRGSLLVEVLAALAYLGAASSARAQVIITLQGDCPGRMTFAWQGAAPDELAGLLFALNTGNYVLSHICQGTVLGLGSHQLQLVRSFRTGPDGRGEMSGPAPRRACGGYVQMIVVDGICTTSNVVQIPH
ncbi:MAG: hypothetical protein KJZ69_01070 [Phycisphaerales bacterium]|nr:hypothetical protein [Phycisphaerales bacterium]